MALGMGWGIHIPYWAGLHLTALMVCSYDRKPNVPGAGLDEAVKEQVPPSAGYRTLQV
jgi:hypothetical protein